MNTKTYNPDVQVEYVVGNDSYSLVIPFAKLLSDFVVVAVMQDVVADALQTDGVYLHPFHVRIGDMIGVLSVNLV